MSQDPYKTIQDDELQSYLEWQKAFNEDGSEPPSTPILTALVYFEEDPTGGVVVGGWAAWDGIHGGILLGGSAQPDIEQAVSGGVVVGSNATVSGSQTISVSGGVVIGGVADVSESDDVEVSGGVVAGGVSVVTITFSPSISGGVVAGGLGDAGGSVTEIPTGGAVSGGVAVQTISFSPPASGGVEILQARYANGYKYRLLLTVPASKVDANLEGFIVGWSTDTLSTSDILITDTSDNTKPSEVRELDDILTVFFRADLSSSVDNDFYVYWGN